MKVLQIHDKQPLVGTIPQEGETGKLCTRRGGGIAVYVDQLVRGLRERGTQVAVVRFDPDGQRGSAVDNGSYRLPAFRYRLRLSVLARLRQIVERENPDVIHLHSMPTLHPLVLRQLLRSRPVVWMFHDVTPFCFRGNKLHADGTICSRPLGFGCVTSGCHRPGGHEGALSDTIRLLNHRLYLGMYRRVPTILVPSAYLKSVLVENGISAERTWVVPLFSRFEAGDHSNRCPEEPPRILFVGRLTRDKGVLSLIEALGRLLDEPWQATVVGDGPLREVARRLAETRGVASRIRFADEATEGELPECYRACSFVVVPSLGPESFGMVGVEAMSFAKPVVSYRSGGVTEWLEDEVTGCIVPHGDVDGLANSMRRLLREPAQCVRFGEAAQRRQRESFTLSAHLDRIVPRYRQAIERFTEQRR